MKAIIDSGSSKADWVFIDRDQHHSYLETIGFNPLTTDAQQFMDSFYASKNKPNPEAINEVFFYGTGCSTQEAIDLVQNVLQQLFPKAKITVEHDLLGAARAVYQGKPCLVAILGTGSNSCLFDGIKIIDKIPNLGYLLGDEGAGFAIGKEVLRSYFYREFSPELTNTFQDQYHLTRNKLIQQIYNSSSPNRDIAAFAEFAVTHRAHQDIKNLVTGVFQEFVDRNLLKYKITPSIQVHFIGSIAYFFRDRMEKILEKTNILPGIFLRKPIDGLVQYHSKY